MKTYNYQGKDYPARKKSFKSYRLKAITFMRKYDEFETANFPSIAINQAEIQTKLLNENKLTNNAIHNDENKLNKAVGEIINKTPELTLKIKKIAEEQAIAKELFLFTDSKGVESDENVKVLCDVMLEDSKDIKHNDDEMDYEDYIKFINELWADFFLMNKKL